MPANILLYLKSQCSLQPCSHRRQSDFYFTLLVQSLTAQTVSVTSFEERKRQRFFSPAMAEVTTIGTLLLFLKSQRLWRTQNPRAWVHNTVHPERHIALWISEAASGWLEFAMSFGRVKVLLYQRPIVDGKKLNCQWCEYVANSSNKLNRKWQINYSALPYEDNHMLHPFTEICYIFRG